MRLAPFFIAALVVACDVPRERAEKRPGDADTRVSQRASDSPAAGAVQGGSVPAFVEPGSSAPAGSGGEGDGAAELARLAAARKPILLRGEGGEEVSASEFTADAADDPARYAGDYHFGDSEAESTLTLTVRGNTVTGSLGYADWENETWVGKEVRLEGGRIVGSRLIAPGWSGVFVLFQGQPGLVMLRAPNDMLCVEFGEKL